MKRYCYGLDRKGPPSLFCRFLSTPSPRAGFTVIELLVILVLIMLLTTLTLRPIGSGDDPAEVSRAAFRLVQDFQRAQSQARADRRPRYWVVPGPGAQWTGRVLEDVTYEAYQFVEEIDPLPEEIVWVRLPEGMVFSPDSDTDVQDLLESDAYLEYARSGEFEQIIGDFRVIAVILPDGSVRVGPDGDTLTSSLRLSRGSWTGGVYLDDEEGGQPVRIRIRTRTGVMVVEEVS